MDKVRILIGPQGGMSLVMDPSLNQYSNVVVNDFISQGLMLLITNEPEAYQISDIIGLEPGSVTLVSISAVKSYVNKPAYQVWPLPCKLDAKLRFMPGCYDAIEVDLKSRGIRIYS